MQVSTPDLGSGDTCCCYTHLCCLACIGFWVIISGTVSEVLYDIDVYQRRCIGVATASLMEPTYSASISVNGYYLREGLIEHSVRDPSNIFNRPLASKTGGLRLVTYACLSLPAGLSCDGGPL